MLLTFPTTGKKGDLGRGENDIRQAVFLFFWRGRIETENRSVQRLESKGELAKKVDYLYDFAKHLALIRKAHAEEGHFRCGSGD